MEHIAESRLQELAARLEQQTQHSVMQYISQFSQAEICSAFGCPPPGAGDTLHPLVFNMERGVHLDAQIEFLQACPDVQPFDLLLANELDDGCVRSGGRDVAAELARALGMYYVFGLEFIELTDLCGGMHGNAVFSRWPIVWAEVLRLPEQYNWYFDRQKRIGGRCAVFAKIDLGGRQIGAVSVHLENRTDGAGRCAQMRAVLEHAGRVFGGLPVVIGGDLNTNTFDGRDTGAIQRLAAKPSLLREQIAQIDRYEPLLADCEQAGYAWRTASGGGQPTRRKPVPDGKALPLRLDWILPRGLRARSSRVVSTRTADCGFAAPDGALAQMTAPELSDHDAVWASLGL